MLIGLTVLLIDYFVVQKTSILDVTEEGLKVFRKGDSPSCCLITNPLL